MLRDVDALLRGSAPYEAATERLPVVRLAAVIALSGFVYGAVMGSHAGRPLQSLYSGIKVPMLLAVSSAICMPSFYVVNAANGLRDDFAAAMRGVLFAQATVAVTLAALSPVTIVGYVSTGDYDTALLLNGVMFATASLAGQVTLLHHYQPLLARDPRHRRGLVLWLGLYWFVTIQLAWLLRPFLGAADLPTTFLREDTWGNAYLKVFDVVSRWLIGS